MNANQKLLDFPTTVWDVSELLSEMYPEKHLNVNYISNEKWMIEIGETPIDVWLSYSYFLSSNGEFNVHFNLINPTGENIRIDDLHGALIEDLEQATHPEFNMYKNVGLTVFSLKEKLQSNNFLEESKEIIRYFDRIIGEYTGKLRNVKKDEEGVTYSSDGKILIKFDSKDAERYKVNDGTEIIWGGAFENCRNLREVVLPEGLQRIYGYAFSGCTELRTLVLPKSIKQIGSYAFNRCPLGIFHMPDNVDDCCFPGDAFSGCTIGEVQVGAKIYSININ